VGLELLARAFELVVVRVPSAIEGPARDLDSSCSS
jgi:hypothetical protein